MNYDQLETVRVTFDDIAAHVMLNRPDAKNAMNMQMVKELHAVFTHLRENRDVRAIVLSGAEGTFCAGGDIKEMRENPMPARDEAGNLDAMLRAANEAAQVVIAKIEGVALGGGLGLACVADIAIAAEDARFGLPEVRLGIAPAFISPYVIQRIGLTRARELMLTGRRFDGKKAHAYGIIHEVAPADELDHFLEIDLDYIRQAAPGAIAATKSLIFEVMNRPLDATLDFRAEMLNSLRASDEAQEGMLSFIEKRPAKWANNGEVTPNKL